MFKRTFLVCFDGIFGGLPGRGHSRAIIPLERPKTSDVCCRRVAKNDTIRYLPKLDHLVTLLHIAAY